MNKQTKEAAEYDASFSREVIHMIPEQKPYCEKHNRYMTAVMEITKRAPEGEIVRYQCSQCYREAQEKAEK